MLLTSLVGLLLLPILALYLSHPLLPFDGSKISSLLEQIRLVLQDTQSLSHFTGVPGPLNLAVPAIVYSLFGEAPWTIFGYLIALKLATIGFTYGLASHLSDRFYGLIALILMTLFLGQTWPILQNINSLIQSLPWIFASWWLLLGTPQRYHL